MGDALTSYAELRAAVVRALWSRDYQPTAEAQIGGYVYEIADKVADAITAHAEHIAEQARAEERARIVAWLRDQAAKIEALRSGQTTMGARFDGWERATRFERIADAIERGDDA